MKKKIWKYVTLTYNKNVEKLKSNMFINKLFDFNFGEPDTKCDFTEKRFYIVDLNNITDFYIGIYNLLSLKKDCAKTLYALKKDKTISELQRQFLLINYDRLNELKSIKSSTLFIKHIYENMLHSLDLFKYCDDYDFMKLAIKDGLVFNNETDYMTKINNSNTVNYHTRIINIDIFYLV